MAEAAPDSAAEDEERWTAAAAAATMAALDLTAALRVRREDVPSRMALDDDEEEEVTGDALGPEAGVGELERAAREADDGVGCCATHEATSGDCMISLAAATTGSSAAGVGGRLNSGDLDDDCPKKLFDTDQTTSFSSSSTVEA